MTYQINGFSGVGDFTKRDNSVAYGQNFVENKVEYLAEPFVKDNVPPAPILDFSTTDEAQDINIKKLDIFVRDNDKYLNSLPPLECEYRYMPQFGEGKVDNKAVLSVAYHEMGGEKSMSVYEFETMYLPNTEEYTAKPLDINFDGKIDIAEYAANIIATDLLSKGTTNVRKVDGTFNAKGLDAIMEYTKKANKDAALALYSEIYHTYDLGSTLNNPEISELPDLSF